MVIVVGSGAGGGVLSLELAKSGIPVTIIEKGPLVDSKDAFNYYNDPVEGMDLLSTTCVGGDTIVSAGNGVRSSEDMLAEYGIDLTEEFEEMEELLNIHEMDDSHIGRGTQLFIDSARELGLNVSKMPKFIYEDKCIQCGRCAYGCPNDAKWNGSHSVKEAVNKYGAKLLTNSPVTNIIVEDGKVKGVEIGTEEGTEIVEDDLVVLCAGAVTDARLLQKLGIPAGQQFATDPFVTVGAVIKDIGFNTEVTMNALVKGEHFVLAPHYSSKYLDGRVDEQNLKPEDIISIMVKIPDEAEGYVNADEIVKYNSIRDVQYLAEGAATAGAILQNAGANSIYVSTVFRSAHPGSTAPIGKIVDSNLKTGIDGLYVSDGSVFPRAPGAPPILAIAALSKRLSKHLIEKLNN